MLGRSGVFRACRWIRGRYRKWLTVLLEGAGVLGAVLVFVSAAVFLVERAIDTWFWRGGEYDKLTSLRAGFDMRYFEDQLGPPFTSRVRGGYRENGFRGRDYWVQTVGRNGTVQLYAVTSCEKSFHPTFTIAGTDVEIELNRDHLADVVPGGDPAFEYSIGASAPSLFYEALYGGRSGFYKTTIWGFSSLCRLPDGVDVPTLEERHSGYTSSLNEEGEEFRQQAVVNTFAESAPAVADALPSNFGIELGNPERRGEIDMGLYQFGDFYIGPDRVLLQGGNS